MSFRQNKQSWKKSGIFSRETKMLADIGRITHLFSGKFSNIKPEKLESDILYVNDFWKMLMILLKSQKITLITNQDSSLILALPMYLITFYKTQLIYRSGYNQVNFFIRRKKKIKAILMLLLTMLGDLCCSLRIVSNEIDAAKYKNSLNKVVVIPNSETITKHKKNRKYTMLHVGRRSKQKRSEIVHKVLNNYSSVLVTNIKNIDGFHGEIFANVSNEAVLDLMRNSKYFLLLSEFEGSPKALIEAISKGCIPVVSQEVRRTLPQSLQQYFTLPLLDVNYRMENLKSIENQYELGKIEVQNYFSRKRNIQLWKENIDSVNF